MGWAPSSPRIARREERFTGEIGESASFTVREGKRISKPPNRMSVTKLTAGLHMRKLCDNNVGWTLDSSLYRNCVYIACQTLLRGTGT